MRWTYIIYFICFLATSEVTLLFPKSDLNNSKIRLKTEKFNQILSRGISFLTTENYAEAEAQCKQALDLAEQIGSQKLIGQASHYLGEAYLAQIQHEAALKSFTRAFQYLPPERLRFLTQTRIADINLKIHLYAKALHYYKPLLPLSRQLGDSLQQLTLFGKIADCYFQLGEPSFAYLAYHQGLKLALQTRNQVYETRFLSDVGHIYYYFGEYNDALEYFNLALAKCAELNRPNLKGDIHSRLGSLYQAVGDSSDAKYHYLTALQIYKQTRNHAGAMKTLNLIGELFIGFGAYEKALKLFEMALAMHHQYKLHPLMPQVNLGMAYCYLNLNDLEESAIFFHQVQQTAARFQEKSLLWKTHLGQAQIFEKQEKYNAAMKEYELGIRIVEKQRLKIYFDAYRSGFFAKMLPLYEGYVKLLLEKDSTDSSNVRKAFHFMERFRARSFLEALSEIDIKNSTVSPDLDSLLTQKYFIEQKLFGTLSEIDKLPLLNTPAVKSLRQRLFQERAKYETELYRHGTEIEKIYTKTRQPDYESNVVLTLEELQDALLSKDVVVLEYFLSDPHSFVWVISQKRFAIYKIPARSKIISQIRLFLASVSYPEKRFSSLFEKPCSRLYDMLIAPIASALKPNQKLVIIPDGELAYLPFELLRIPGYSAAGSVGQTWTLSSEKKYLIEQYRILYAPSASVFINSNMEKNKKFKHASELLILGDSPFSQDSSQANPPASSIQQNYNRKSSLFWPVRRVKPLFYSREEVDNITQLFHPSQVKIMVGREASESNFKSIKNLKDYRQIHFATHGLINENNPQLSGLLLGLPDAQADGFLRIPEIYQLELRAKLVVLSGCQTGRGRLSRANGVESLARAFLAAGTASVIVSLWSVDDRSTSIFMKNFYRNLEIENLTISEALAMSKIDMLQSGEFQHPYYWAPFILISGCE